MNNYTISTNDIYFLNDKNIISAINDKLLANKINPIPSYDVVANMSSYVSNEITALTHKFDEYVKLSGGNVISGENSFISSTTLNNVNINGITNVNFQKIYDVQGGKLSDIIGDDILIETLMNMYRLVDNIIIYAKLDIEFDYTYSLNNLVETIKSIINSDASLTNNPELTAFLSYTINEITIRDIYNIIKIIVNSLNIKQYSLHDILNSIDNSIDALDVYFTNITKTLSNDISYLSAQIDNNNTCAIISVDTLHTIIDSLSDSISSNYALISTIPLSTSQLLNNGDGHNNRYMLNDKLSLSSGYDINNYNLCIIYDGVSIAKLNANEFIKDSVLSGVELFDYDNNPYLQFTWIVISGGNSDKTPITNKVYLSSLTDDLAKQTIVNELSTGIYNYADYLSNAIDNMSSDVSVNLYNLASYRGHIQIHLGKIKNEEPLSLSSIFHDNTIAPNGFVKNGTIIDVTITNGVESNEPQYLSTLSYETTDGFVLHNKDFIIVHESKNGRSNIPVEEINQHNVKTITIINEPLFYSLCCAVSSNYFWLDGNNTVDNNHAISGDNDYINGLNRFETISAINLTGDTVVLTTMSSISTDIISANISNLTALNSDLSNVGISNLTATHLSATNLSIDLNNLINLDKKSSDKYPNVYKFITSTELSIDQLSDVLNNKISIDMVALGTEGLNLQHISQDDYHELILSEDGPLSNTLYVVSSDSLNMYGERIINMGAPISANDATTKQYVDDISTALSTDYQTKLDNTTNNINNISNIVDNKIIIDAVSADQLILQHISQDDYHTLILNEEALSNTLYIVSSDSLNMYDERIINLATGISANDAVNLRQVTLSIETETRALNNIINDVNKQLSISIDNKIIIDAVSADQLILQHISQDDYHTLILNEEALSNTLYIVSSDSLNMYGERIINLANPISASDAVNKKYVDDISTQISNDYQTQLNNTSTNINNISNIIDNKIIIDKVSADQLILQHISQDDYHELILSEDGPLSNTLYVVSSDSLNMYDERITNMGAPISANDAVNKKYVDDISTTLSNDYIEKIEAKSNIYLSSITNTGLSGGKLDQLNLVKFDAISTYTLCCSEDSSLVTISDLVLIEEDQLNAEGDRIINVATPELSSDAANKWYVDDKLNSQNNIKQKINENPVLSTIYEYGENKQLDDINCGQVVAALYELIKIFHD